jgi:peptidoglycan/xylan/chitin deacetylase (PgdA/CDA1 family)
VRALALAAALVLAGFPPALRGKELERLPTRKREVALTFDAGGNADGAWSLVRTLRRRHVPATFFLTGRWVRQNRSLARVIGRSFSIGNHTADHSSLITLPNAAVEREIVGAQRTIRAVTGRDPRPFFRFPFGARDARTIAIANRLGYLSVRWTVDTLGWMGGGSQTASGAMRRVLQRLQPGTIVLMHVGASRDGATIDTRALPAVIAALRRRGYSFTTLERFRRPG